jgi:hypothetical protein
MEADTEEDLAEDTRLLHRAEETSAEAAASLRQLAGSMAAGSFTGPAHFTAVEDIMAPVSVSDSVSVSTRLTAMRRRSAIPPVSMMQTAYGNTIRVALCRTDIRLAGPRFYAGFGQLACLSRTATGLVDLDVDPTRGERSMRRSREIGTSRRPALNAKDRQPKID